MPWWTPFYIPDKIRTINTPYNVGSVLRRLFSTAEYWTASAVLMLSLRSTDVIPPQYWCYASAVLMLSLCSTDAIPPQHWTASAVLMLPPQYWCYSPAVLMLSPRSTDASPRSTDAIPRSTDAIPPQYWIASTVLNSLRSTEPMLYGVLLPD